MARTKKKRNKVNFSPTPISLKNIENILTCFTLHFGTSIQNSEHLDDSVYQIISNIQGAEMASACPTHIHTAAQKLKASSIHVHLILPEHELHKCPPTDNSLLCKT